MKLAGSKNPGAWYRANKQLQKLVGPERTALGTLITASPHANAAFNALLALQTEAGVTVDGIPSDLVSWVAKLIGSGIPLQVWMGHLTITTYSQQGDEYRANYQSEIHYFGHDLRKIVRRFLALRREVRDVFDIGTAKEGNPGGNPDGPYQAPAGS